MPWKERRGKQYYYQSRRVGRRVISDYVGTGLIAECTAQVDQLSRGRRALTRAQAWAVAEEFADIDRALDYLEQQLRTLVAATLEAAGFHQHHRGEWRKRRMSTSKRATRSEQNPASLYTIVARADGPKATADDQAALRRLYDEVPAVWKGMGDLASSAQGRLITVAVESYSHREAIGRTIRAVRDELGYGAASQLEKLLIEQIVICWLRMQIQEIRCTQALHDTDGCSATKAEHHERMLVSTQARYLRAIEGLARVRRLLKLPAVQLNIAQPGSQQINVAGEVKM
jgi:hypothetical protein